MSKCLMCGDDQMGRDPGSRCRECGYVSGGTILLTPVVEEEIQPYDSDHTALVHVLWDAKSNGITINDADWLAQHIMGSKWMRAVLLHANK